MHEVTVWNLPDLEEPAVRACLVILIRGRFDRERPILLLKAKQRMMDAPNLVMSAKPCEGRLPPIFGALLLAASYLLCLLPRTHTPLETQCQPE